MRKIFLFLYLFVISVALHAQSYTFNMYDATNDEYRMTVTVDLTNQVVSAKDHGEVIFSSPYYGYKIYKEKNRIGLALKEGKPADVNAETSTYFIIIRDNGNIIASFDGYEFPMRSVNVSATANTYDQLAKALTNTTSNRTFTVGGVSFTMVYVQGGTFTMGATSEQVGDADSDEKPAHRVTLNNYYIGQTEVTQALWQAVMGNNPSHFKGNNQRPVEYVSWDDCQSFIRKLNSLTGQRFRLPTEAEWEYAARGGVKSRGYKYSGSNTIDNVAWYDGNSGNTTHPVGTKSANELGIYDMSGNVLEWCSDWYGENYYSNSPGNNPQGPSSGSFRVFRGGSWDDYAGYCRVANRLSSSPGYGSYDLGLRLAL